ncbi:MAG: tRNA (adenosine(37)-N6)-threonylcarbamoyltransferase complex dimerization subunit type 1 TsaB [Gemmatimonadales bacterium]
MSDGLTLALDGSTYAGSAAVIRDRDVVAERVLADIAKPGRAGREEMFMPMVAACLADAGVAPGDLSRVVCGAGPGSFTSLRIAASIAKGIAIGTGSPLYAVSSLALIVAAGPRSPGTLLAVLPAMRGEMFAAPFQVGETEAVQQTGPPFLVAEAALMAEAERRGARVVGPAVKGGDYPRASGVARLLDDILDGELCDSQTWEPTYGRLAEAQVRWEAAHGRPLTAQG